MAAAAMAALAAGMAACGGSSSHAAGQGARSSASPRISAVRAVQAAYTATTAAKTARILLQAKTVGAGATSKSLTVSEHGLVDFSGHRAQLFVRLPGGLGTIEIRLTGKTLYERLPARERSQLPGHTPWVKVNLARLGAKAGTIPGGRTASPGNALKVLRQAASSVTKVETTKIAGTPVTEYRAVVNAHPVNVWVDRDDRVRRLEGTSLLSPAGRSPSSPAGTQQKLKVTITFDDFGVPVTVSPPPPGNTTDLTSLFARRAATATGA